MNKYNGSTKQIQTLQDEFNNIRVMPIMEFTNEEGESDYYTLYCDEDGLGTIGNTGEIRVTWDEDEDLQYHLEEMSTLLENDFNHHYVKG